VLKLTASYGKNVICYNTLKMGRIVSVIPN